MDLQILYEIRDLNAKLDEKFDTLIDINQQILEALQDKK